jgi:hypothetical protein
MALVGQRYQNTETRRPEGDPTEEITDIDFNGSRHAFQDRLNNELACA